MGQKTQPLTKVYNRLLTRFGPQQWWPGNSKLEIIIGAILTQNTNWNNVEKAIKNLKNSQLLNPADLHKISTKKLAQLIKPSGFFNVKAKRIKNFIDFLFANYNGNISRMAKEQLPHLRKKILSVNGIGKETADSILLYAFRKPIFVVDAYTKRILYRHALIKGEEDYDTLQNIFQKNLPAKTQLFNEYHALIVRVGKDYCRTKPRCESCPLHSTHYSIEERCSRCYKYLPNGSRCCSACLRQ